MTMTRLRSLLDALLPAPTGEVRFTRPDRGTWHPPGADLAPPLPDPDDPSTTLAVDLAIEAWVKQRPRPGR